ncbi:hypothetical protein HIM_01838 [Hirsutella minnesotensis 3608]|nr:hypothetical protein HIM_01838 [Hirsutella minnesotensis 3608]
MPFYYYHLKLEIYSSPAPTSVSRERTNDETCAWVPRPGFSIFDELPAHPRIDRDVARTQPQRQPRSDKPHSAASTFHAKTLESNSSLAVIDCGAPRAPSKDDGRIFEATREAQWLDRSRGSAAPASTAAIRPRTAIKDWRFGRIRIETVDPAPAALAMPSEASKAGPSAAPSLGPAFSGAGTATKAECLPLRSKNTELGWGVVHFYRDGEESPLLSATEQSDDEQDPQDSRAEDACTTLCIPAIPAYMSPGDFMGFVGDRWMDDISHCRMVMTSRMNRYLVLLKFRDAKRARQWRNEFDGRVFNSMESQVCHVVFIKSITFETPTERRGSDQATASSSAVSNSLKPFPPPPPNLIELPTCPVCLERMDETNGLMTIPCSHVFHCTCLQNWKGAGCPVCRFTNTASQTSAVDSDNPYSQPFGSPVSNLCSVCDCADDLWICLICGYVGCGRYKGGHAKDHWKDTAHSFALELETQHVWDYAGDMWVHRLIRDKGDGKVVELPGRREHGGQREDEDVVPRAKLENIGLEYTHLITSQLESQRAYYEEMITKAVDKAAKAAAVAESSASKSTKTMERLADLEAKYKTLTTETVPQLERDLEREKNKASKAETLARSLGQSLQEEKRLNEGLMKRIEHVGAENESLRKQVEGLREETADLKDMNRDLTMFISGQEKLKELEQEGNFEEGEIAEGSTSVPEKKNRRRGRKK